MKRAVFLAAVVALTAIVTALARFPLAAAAAWAPLEENGVSYGDATGYVWGGSLEDVRWNGNDFGKVDLAVIRHKALLGRLVAAFRADGRDMAGRGFVRALPGGAVGLSRLDVNLRVERQVAGTSLIGRLRVTGEDIRIGPAGACLASDAQVTTTVLAESARPFGWDAPDLSGPVACEGDVWFAALSGERAGVAVALDARFTGEAVRAAVMRVTGAGDDLRAQLLLLGFREGADGALRYEWSGAVGDAADARVDPAGRAR